MKFVIGYRDDFHTEMHQYFWVFSHTNISILSLNSREKTIKCLGEILGEVWAWRMGGLKVVTGEV